MSAFSELINLNDTLGAFLIGTFASAVLLGVTCMQAFYYFMTYSDGIFIRMTVASLVILEIGQLALTIHAIYHYLIINYANPAALLKTVWSIDVLLGYGEMTVLIVHLSYAFRIYHVSGRKKLIPTLIAIVALGHYSTGWVLAASLFRLTSLLDISGFPETMGKTILSVGAAIDITIAATLSYYLHMNRSGLKETDRMINRLIKYTINNGALTSVMDLVALSLVISRPRDYLFFSVVLVLASLYSNSLLATFNSRRATMERDIVSSSGSEVENPTGTLSLQFQNVTRSMNGRASITGSRGVCDPELQNESRGAPGYQDETTSDRRI